MNEWICPFRCGLREFSRPRIISLRAHLLSYPLYLYRVFGWGWGRVAVGTGLNSSITSYCSQDNFQNPSLVTKVLEGLLHTFIFHTSDGSLSPFSDPQDSIWGLTSGPLHMLCWLEQSCTHPILAPLASLTHLLWLRLSIFVLNSQTWCHFPHDGPWHFF